MSKEFILKACKLFRRCADTIIILRLSSYFEVYFLKLMLILFYNWVVNYYTGMFLILFPHHVKNQKAQGPIN